jgi:elongation factor Ts
MNAITASLVKDLRERTGAGMMDCKKALTETDGDLAAAADWLRTKGLAAAAKKFGRVAAEGLVGVASGPKSAAIVEINSETDFVSRNEDFQNLVTNVAKLALDQGGDFDAVGATAYPGNDRTVTEEITSLVATIGENMSLRRTAMLSVDDGVVSSYVHGPLATGLGRIGVIVGLKSTGDAAQLDAFGKQLAMHIAATNPQSVGIDGLDPELVKRERELLADQARESGKPDNIVEKMVEGRIRKYFQEVVLTEQTFVIDNETKIADAVAAVGESAGGAVEITGFVRFALGEGIEKEESDFAAEVAAVSGA